MNHHSFAPTPPMGWNSWDCYGASVTEEEVRGNAQYIAEHLKEYGWNYVIVDIQWYEPSADSSRYHSFYPLEMDEYSRLIPATNRFPSAVGGQGFKPLADYIHSLGLKFGIHLMRGIPRQAVHAATPILGTNVTARDIAHPNSICQWNTDMYGVDSRREGAQEYYNSLLQLYTSWDVDYIKVDDLSAPHYAKGEIELLRQAIDNSGRNIVLSTSPGPAPIEESEHLIEHANLWRMTNDYWDLWGLLLDMFDRCHQWASHVGPGHWPDCDMLPLGHIGIRNMDTGGDRMTRFTKDEQLTMMTLWSVFRSPLMFGGELRDNDEWTLSLLTNKDVLHLNQHGHSARQLYREGNHIVWTTSDEENRLYAALFNTGETEEIVSVTLDQLGLNRSVKVYDLWNKSSLGTVNSQCDISVPSHGAVLVRLD
jgi:alpha-galactosidase